MIASLIFAVAAVASPPPLPKPTCYDAAIIGYIREHHDPRALDDLLPAQPQHIYFGARWDLEVDVEKKLTGVALPYDLHVRGVLTEMKLPSARLLMLLQRSTAPLEHDDRMQVEDGGYIPAGTKNYPWRLVYLASASEPFDPDAFPRCRKDSQGTP